MRPLSAFGLLAALLVSAPLAPARAEAPFSFDTTPGRLPKTVRPEAYRIDIAPDLKTLTLKGREEIDIVVRTPVTAVTLNQAGLTLQSATLETGAAASISLDEKRQTATLSFPNVLAAGRHRLTIAYSGPILSSPNGIYYNDYKTASGSSERMLVTQFEVADARRMFPGWDEPAFKATFQLSATLPEAFAAVSNMPISTVAPAGLGTKHVAFAPSPRMSTYLVALLAGDLSSVNGEAAGVKMAAWAPRGREDQGRYALQVEEQVLPYYNAYFGLPYPLPKLDLIAVPGNYEAGAMENWGAITFIDDAMLFDPQTSSPGTREEIFKVVAHEMAHQWSGDLVTMGWWDNIWLNEGFATWMETKASDHFNPSWDIWPRQHADREAAMAQDALPTTHPVHQPIRDESEANAAFDDISYLKGGQVIRMIEDWLGPDVFREGMRRYMRAHAYSNATSADLWDALGQASGRDVSVVANSFTDQPGVPLLRASRSCAGGIGRLTLTQDRFTIEDPDPKPEDWTIPVTLGGPGAAPKRVLLTKAPLSLDLRDCLEPIKINLGENGYYRTEYDAASLEALARVLPKLSSADRANLLGDQFALFLAKRASLGDYLGLLPRLGDEGGIAVWQDTLTHLRRLDAVLVGLPQRKTFDAYAIALIRPEFARLGWDARPGETPLDGLLRPQLIVALGQFGDPDIIAEAGRRFNAFVADPVTLPAGLRSAVLGIVGHNADPAVYDALQRLGVKATSTEEKLRYFFAMAAASDPALIRRNVAFALSGEIQNARIVAFIAAASRTCGNPDLLYDLVKPSASKIDARAPGDGLAPTGLMAAASGSLDPDLARRLLAEPSSLSSSGARIMAARIAGGVNLNAALRARVAATPAAWRAAS